MLIEYGADVLAPDAEGWTLTNEATASGNAELLALVLARRNALMQAELRDRFPQLLSLLAESGDFYVEMSWDFSSLLPFVSRLCPSDTYRIWKRGATVRIDTTLLGFSNMKWLRGARSFIFRTTDAGGTEMVQLNHDSAVAVIEPLESGAGERSGDGGGASEVSREELAQRLGAPVTNTRMDQERVSFTRVRSGIWGFQSDLSEQVSGVTCRVFNVSDVEVVTRTRFEHLPPQHPARRKKKTPMGQILGLMGGRGAEEMPEDLLGAVETTDEGGDFDEADADPDEGSQLLQPRQPRQRQQQRQRCTEAEYFHATDAAVGREREQRIEKQKLSAKVWMSDEFPLSVQQQLVPIIELLAPTSSHISKLRDFITLQLPAGFPVKLEIPVYYVLKARVTFGAYRALTDADAAEVTPLLAVPPTYRVVHGDSDAADQDEDRLLARAMQQSLYGGGGGGGGGGDDDFAFLADEAYDPALQQALLASMMMAGEPVPGGGGPALLLPPAEPAPASMGGDWPCEICTFLNTKPLALACEMCGTQRPLQQPGPARRPAPATAAFTVPPADGEEDTELQRILALSMTEK